VLWLLLGAVLLLVAVQVAVVAGVDLELTPGDANSQVGD
jgi:hypothetical protein